MSYLIQSYCQITKAQKILDHCLKFKLNINIILYALTETQKPSHVGKGTQYML